MNLNNYQKIVDSNQTLLDKSKHPWYTLGCLLIKHGRVIKRGSNSLSSKPFYAPEGPGKLGRHAEISCLHMLSRDITKGATLIVLGKTKAGNQITTRPCSSCYKHIQKMGIKRIVYQDINGNLIEERI